MDLQCFIMLYQSILKTFNSKSLDFHSSIVE